MTTRTTSHAESLQALADPTRRLVFERLKTGPRPVAELAAGLHVSRPAVSQHLRILRAARLVAEQRVGRQRFYRVETAGLEALRHYLDEFWGDVLGRFKTFAESEEARRAPGAHPEAARTRPQGRRRRAIRR